MTNPKVLQGHSSTYRLKSDEPEFLGRLSVLYMAENMQSGAQVIVKIFREEIAEPGAIESFYAELDALMTLEHPNILPILDHGESVPGQSPYFIALPYCSGGNLRRGLSGVQFVPVGSAGPLLRQIGAAIDHAHGQGVIHGDIKPENVLLSGDRRTAFLADFGIARNFPFMERMTTMAQVPARGTSAYLSPEQLSDNQQSTKSDIYSFGLVAYELLTGRLPFDTTAPPFQQMLARVSGELLHPREANPALSDDVGNALLQALHRNPGARPGSAIAFCNLLAPAKKWDLFIAYASPDRTHADRLHSTLSSRFRVFLDHKCLLPGDNWDAALAAAQRDALVTVVLVSTKSGDAYYQREEVAASIDLARKNPDSHRVVPVYLDAAAAEVVPYGLRIKHGILCDDKTNLDVVAEKLSMLVGALKVPRPFPYTVRSVGQDSVDLTTRPKLRAAHLELMHGTHGVEVGLATTLVVIGRDAQNDVVISDPLASRVHARIERRCDTFVLVDQSSNGTFVTIDGEGEIQIRREELVLRGRGRISFGHPYAADPVETVAYVFIAGDA